MASEPAIEGRGPRAPFSFESRIFLLALAVALPSTGVALVLVWSEGHNRWLQGVLTLLLPGLVWSLSAHLRARVARPLQTLANLLSALREGDFSLQARQAPGDDALAQVIEEINAVGHTLREQRLGSVETTALLHRVMEEVDVAVFALDNQGVLRLVNRAGERLLAEPAERILGQDAAALGLAEYLDGEPVRTVNRAFAGRAGNWEIHRSGFREGGCRTACW